MEKKIEAINVIYKQQERRGTHTHTHTHTQGIRTSSREDWEEMNRCRKIGLK